MRIRTSNLFNREVLNLLRVETMADDPGPLFDVTVGLYTDASMFGFDRTIAEMGEPADPGAAAVQATTPTIVFSNQSGVTSMRWPAVNFSGLSGGDDGYTLAGYYIAKADADPTDVPHIVVEFDEPFTVAGTDQILTIVPEFDLKPTLIGPGT